MEIRQTLKTYISTPEQYDLRSSERSAGDLALNRFGIRNRLVVVLSVAAAAFGGTAIGSSNGEEAQAQAPADAPGNTPPNANFSWSPQNPVIGDDVSLDASASYDPDAQPISETSFLWDLDNDKQYDDAMGRFITHKFMTAGYNNVGLQVIDNAGSTDTETQRLTILPEEGQCIKPEPGLTICNTGPSYAKDCMDNALSGEAIAIKSQKDGRINGKKSMRVWVEDGAIKTWDGPPNDNCNPHGYRTIKVWQVMENDRGKIVRNSNIVTAASRTNDAISGYVRLKLRKPYTCQEDGTRYWGLRARQTGYYGNKTKKITQRFSGKKYLRFKSC